MEQNLPFVSLSIADKAYNKRIIPFLGNLDDGKVFKNFITILLSITSYCLLVGGIYLTIVGILGDDGFIKNCISNETITGGKKFGSVLGLIVGFTISIITSWALYSVMKKRTEQIKSLEYTELLDYVFNKTFPKLILLTGEILFIVSIYVGILQIVASLVGSYAYAPLSSGPSMMLGMMPGMDVFNQFNPQQIYGDYNNFADGIKVGLIGIAASFILLITFYIYKEVYNYMLKLVTALINFLPKFAIPLAIRKRSEN